MRHPDREGALYSLSHTGDEESRLQLGVYRCKHCGAWHVGHAIGSGFLFAKHLTRAAGSR